MPDIGHAINFSDRDAENLKINGGGQKRLYSGHWQSLLTPNVFTKARFQFFFL